MAERAGLGFPALWSLAYNASYMIPEMIITTVAAVALYFPLKKYYYGEDLKGSQKAAPRPPGPVFPDNSHF